MTLIELEIANAYAPSPAVMITLDPAWIASVQTAATPGTCFVNLKDCTTLQIQANYTDMVRDWKQARL